MASLEEIEKRRSERRAQHDQSRKDQELADLEAIDKLEAELNEPLHTMSCNAHKKGVCVKIAFKEPSPIQYKRYADMVGRAMQKNDSVERRKAQEMFAEACWVYPSADSESRKAMLDAFPGLLISLAIEAAKVAELRSEEEGKG